MRVAILSDIHSNLAALDAVLAHAGSFDALWCLGDVVGYGPEPNACIERLRELDAVCVAGNHDLAALGRVSLDDFHPEAAAAALWTGEQLTETNREWLLARPETHALPDHAVTLVHGSPRDAIWEYVVNSLVAKQNMGRFETRACLIGHTHLPSTFVEQEDGSIAVEHRVADSKVYLEEGRLLANPGSVGQPRDRNPDAAYLIYDTDESSFTWLRTPYPVEITQEKMVEVGLPPRLANRLAAGW